jgi:hypothetical protein
VNRPITILSLVFLTALVGAVLWWMWSIPAVVHYDNLKYVQLLRTACSSQRMDQIEGVERAIQQRKDSGNMTDREWEEFVKILALARSGQWRNADQATLRLEQAQLNRHRPAIK